MLKNIKSLREEKGWSQKQLAEAIGVSQQSINKYENHNIEPDIDTLIRIADCFSTSVDYLIGHTEERRVIVPLVAYHMSDAEFDLVRKYRLLTDKQKKSVDMVVDTYNQPL